MINEQYERAKRLLKQYSEGHGKLSELLITEEVIFADDLKKVFGERQWTSRSEEILKDTEDVVPVIVEALKEEKPEVRAAEQEQPPLELEDTEPKKKEDDYPDLFSQGS